jgi:hypothetical protein
MTTMRLLKTPGQYVLVSCAYLANAINISYQSIHRAGSVHKNAVNLGIVLPLLIGVSLLILLIPTALRHTSILIEKALVIITGILLLSSIIAYLRVLGEHWALLPYGNLIFLLMSWLAAILAGWLTREAFKDLHTCPKHRANLPAEK